MNKKAMISNFNLTFLILILVFGIHPCAWSQEQRGYRVEVLVLRHLDGAGEPWPAAELPDLEALLDLEARERALAGPPELPEDPFDLAPQPDELLPPLGPFPDEREPWAGVRRLGERSERMQAVWRNLRLSAEFRPEIFLAWEQPGDEPFPLLRIHGEEILARDDAFAHMRYLAPAYAFQYHLESGDMLLKPIPDPKIHYTIDGSIRLRRSRFLHLDLDIGFYSPAPGTFMGLAGPPLLPAHQAYYVFPIRQSRQVRTGRMEYFDSPVLGVLAWVTEIELSDGAPE